jgi:hypothetical protein
MSQEFDGVGGLALSMGKDEAKDRGGVEPVRGDQAVLARPVIKLSELGID